MRAFSFCRSVLNRVMHYVPRRRRTMMHHAVMNRPVMHHMMDGMVHRLRHGRRRYQRAKSDQTGDQYMFHRFSKLRSLNMGHAMRVRPRDRCPIVAV